MYYFDLIFDYKLGKASKIATKTLKSKSTKFTDAVLKKLMDKLEAHFYKNLKDLKQKEYIDDFYIENNKETGIQTITIFGDSQKLLNEYRDLEIDQWYKKGSKPAKVMLKRFSIDKPKITEVKPC